ncbi:MAG: MerR family transcriptional regulator [Rhodococcus sp. (in: high G+C Gram-positive bacteria)]|uniref:MerR family transcriptional regulator n=2 Tax=unclassified Rhodococcus (in: high G+C Gram-positive bacteria) TaxID=192944 RepID=UPI000EF88962|nr:MerR family transcriptional regulator [Rhodococcus sp. SBT000017]RMB78645.1 MerR family transcriptional regulator [Rhodococcus sp. SBT000017]
MRIGSLADAAGTTPRTVRHYHRLGLLGEPRRLSNGYREYTIDDVVRLMRIRWLADAGMPLGAIAAALDRSAPDESDVVADLRALVAGIEAEQKALAHKHARLSALLDDAVEHRRMTALPRDAADTLAALIDAAAETDRESLLRERDLLEVMAISGTVPASFFESITATLADPGTRLKYLALLRRFSALEGRGVDDAAGDIDSLAAELASVLDMKALASAEPEVTAHESGPLSIDDIVPDPAQRAVIIEAIARLQTSEPSRAGAAR